MNILRIYSDDLELQISVCVYVHTHACMHECFRCLVSLCSPWADWVMQHPHYNKCWERQYLTKKECFFSGRNKFITRILEILNHNAKILRKICLVPVFHTASDWEFCRGRSFPYILPSLFRLWIQAAKHLFLEDKRVCTKLAHKTPSSIHWKMTTQYRVVV